MISVQKWPFFRLFFQLIQSRKMFFTILQKEKSPFQAIKTRCSKSRKIDIFPRGLTHGFGPKMAIFQTVFFQAIATRKKSLTIFQNDKTPFYAIKTKSLESRKIDIFTKGLTHGFGPKMAIFPNFFFQAIQARKMSFTIFQNEKTPFQAIKTTSLKSQTIQIFTKGLTNGLSKNDHYSNLFLLAIQAREMSFWIFQNEKMPFYAIKKRNSKSRKIDIFPMAVNPWFWSKNRHFFQLFFLGNIGKENVFYDILKRKNSFLGYKNQKLKRPKNSHFYKGVNS